jgi:hypothetical protein
MLMRFAYGNYPKICTSRTVATGKATLFLGVNSRHQARKPAGVEAVSQGKDISLNGNLLYGEFK